MKRLVVYQSGTGFTRQYAMWIADALSCRAVDLKQTTENMIREHEQVIFGGWIMGNMIRGLDKINKMNPGHLYVFAVGSTPDDIVDTVEIKELNHLGDTPFFYMPGGFRFEQLNFMTRRMLKILKRSAAKKENKNPQEQYMANALGTSFDHSDKKYTEPLLACCLKDSSPV
ncbi:flavodoxin domain-containing protein [Ruminococcus sp. OA3]|uniref:flavodoxin domain-containing protein n=1 Tax=Ruminococcus sp. OA3 TaxID=2914164 RepID=UPI001F054E36|nr:flavodoxin domain-containing protein [Ruminococcus sp. OA3]MCH1981984.1 flavodoxin domain-containing protein [Ruminococcus sp. OA3]